MKNISKFKLIIEDLEKNSYLIIYLKQLVSEFFKSVAFFVGHLVQLRLFPLHLQKRISSVLKPFLLLYKRFDEVALELLSLL